MKSSIVRKITKKMNHWPNKILYWLLLGDPEVIENLYCDFAYLYWKGCSLQYIFPVTSGTRRISLDTDRMTGDCSFSVPVQLDSGLPACPALPARHLTVNRQNPNYAAEKSGRNVHANQQISAQKIRKKFRAKMREVVARSQGAAN